jgi:general secretion pathway protein I
LNSARGFTLLELLIALAIFGVATVALVRLFSTELDRTGRGDRQRAAVALAQSRLDSVILTKPPRDEQVTTGEAPNGLRWRIAVARYREAGLSEASMVALARVTVTVGWDDGDPVVTLTSLRLAPNP